MVNLRRIIRPFASSPIVFDLAVLFCVFLAMMATLFPKLGSAYYYPAWDQAHHLMVAEGFHYAISNLDASAFWIALINSHTIYPPLFHIMAALGFMLFGKQATIGPIVNAPFLLLLGMSTYQLCRIAVSKKAALLSGLLIFFVPLYLDLWADAMTDISSVALFVTLYWTVLKTDYFSSVKWSVISGIVACLLVLSRYAFFSAALPLIFYVIQSIRRNRGDAVTNILLAVIMMVPAEFWYISHWATMQEKLSFFGNPDNYPVKLYNLPGLFDPENWLYFIRASVQVQGIGLIPMAIFGASLTGKSAGKTPYGRYLLWSVAGNFIIQTLWLDKIPKYVEYSYPIILMLSIHWIMNLRRGRLLAVVALTGAMALNLIIAVIRFPMEKPIASVTPKIHILPGVRFEYDSVPWPMERIIREIPTTRENPARLLVLTDTDTLNSVTLSYYAMRQQKTLDITPAVGLYDPIRPRRITEQDFGLFDYVLTKSGGDLGIFVHYGMTRDMNVLFDRSDRFILVNTFALPDGTQAKLYRVREGTQPKE